MMLSAETDSRKAGTVWVLNLDEPTEGITPLVAATFRQAGAGSASALVQAMQLDSPAEIYRRFEAGQRCYTAWVGGELASYGWVSFDRELVGELRLRLQLLPGEAYIWDCCTLPSYRQNRLYSALLAYTLAELRSGPLCRAWIGASRENLASQQGIARAGFHRVADLTVTRMLALRQVGVLAQPNVPETLVEEVRRVFLGNRNKIWLEALAMVKRY